MSSLFPASTFFLSRCVTQTEAAAWKDGSCAFSEYSDKAPIHTISACLVNYSLRSWLEWPILPFVLAYTRKKKNRLSKEIERGALVHGWSFISIHIAREHMLGWDSAHTLFSWGMDGEIRRPTFIFPSLFFLFSFVVCLSRSDQVVALETDCNKNIPPPPFLPPFPQLDFLRRSGQFIGRSGRD